LRLWSVHPRYLDCKGICGLWREGLLALKVLKGETRGYRHHPQLDRFRAVGVDYLCFYLEDVALEMIERGYHPDLTKLPESIGYSGPKVTVTYGQVVFEASHLLSKLLVRDLDKAEQLRQDIHSGSVECHPWLEVVEGGVEPWEKMDADVTPSR
jgi:hypothetical protein